MKVQQKAVYTIPSGVGFAKSIAAQLLHETQDDPAAMPGITILLPTRRACRVLHEAFRQLGGGKSLLLPRLQPLGDIDEEELSLSLAGAEGMENLLDLPPAIPKLRRQLLLAKTIEARRDFTQGPDYALELAGALGRLMDQIHTESLDVRNLAELVPAEFAEHWQITIKFLEIISEAWPKILAEEGMIDSAERRSRLIRALSEYWQQHPPAQRVIAAGSTGSIPAVADLLSVIAGLPSGSVILPGLDQDMDDPSWGALQESHPQYGLRELLRHIGVEREDVKPWPGLAQHPLAQARRALSTELMRPAATAGQWILLQNQKSKLQQFKAAFEGLKLYECGSEREESEIIAVLMRENLQHENATATLITPDRNLARRVAMVCRRWGIAVDDSAGQALSQSPLGGYLSLVLQACLSDLAPVPLLAALKHSHCRPLRGLEKLEELALRGPRPAPGLAGLLARLEGQTDAGESVALLKTLGPILAPLLSLSQGTQAFGDLLQAHITVAEELAGPGRAEKLWAGADGEAAALFLAELQEQTHLVRPCTAHDYAAMLDKLLAGLPVRPAWGTHPRVMILGQLEARMIDADLVIMSGLNEGTWPPEPGHDPWMSRPMRAGFGLPGYERDVGLAAHDFVQGFCAPKVALTRSRRAGGAPAVPARWLQRLETVLQAAGMSAEALADPQRMDWARRLHEHGAVTPLKRPQPRPPVAARPRALSATRIETWLKDPYGIYARYVLRLRKLDPLEQEPEARIRGTLLHDILHNFVNAHKDELPQNAAAILHGMAQDEVAKFHDDPALWSFWWPRFGRLADWYIDHERGWRTKAKPILTEVEGHVMLQGPAGDFTLSAKADRIDRAAQGAAIIDYKSGGTHTRSAIRTGKSPQLAVEGLIALAGGFPGLPAMPVSSLGYWTLTGGAIPGKIDALEGPESEAAIAAAREGMGNLIAAFDDENTPYYSLPCPANAPRFNDYEHLARVREWAALGDAEGDFDTGEAA